MACGSGSTRTRRGSAAPRAGAAAWRVTLPALPTGTRVNKDEFAGYQEDCAFLDARTRQWGDLECDLPVIWSVYIELSCLCARGNASAAFPEDLEALEATQVQSTLS
eukprot:scaffold46502_cov73-Phaeocystis_antarctica.AAC.4